MRYWQYSKDAAMVERALADGTLSLEMVRLKTCLYRWDAEDQAFAIAGMDLNTYARLLGDAEDAFDDGDVFPWQQLCDWADDHAVLRELVAESRNWLTLAQEVGHAEV